MEQQPQEQPPPYASTLSERDQMVELATETLRKEAHSPFGDADAFSIERLRNFLCYAMAADYDAAHFNTVFVTLDRYLASLGETSDVGDEAKAALGAYFWEHVHAPSRALGLPSEAVMVCVRRFAVYQTARGAYKGCNWGVLHTYGVREWAGKLLVDRRAIVPRVAATPALERAFLREIERNVRNWFERLDGFDFEVALHPGVGHRKRGWTQAELGAFELTDLAKRFQARQIASEEFREHCPESRLAIRDLYPAHIHIPDRLLRDSDAEKKGASDNGHVDKTKGLKGKEPAHFGRLWERTKQFLGVLNGRLSTAARIARLSSH
ncbi:hypothetical protein GTA08_BOTSDO12120 [Neofusicoccum parvum]|uniref:Uncharacterized protein n=1 Tax=Neofusicoccum parvum TaxID=310453 RepID=A0ACB5RRK8_9PEZI|nr:hypothetical protein GTA08_BOTSDO12120 [Neofusicoccum parvum]